MTMKMEMMMKCLKIFIFLSFISNMTCIIEHVEDEPVTLPESCEPIIIPMCKDIKYNQTMFPNILGHINQESAKDEVHQYLPLVKINCSPHLQIFLCSIYVPVCNVLETPLKPCRSLCISARKGCDVLMEQFGFRWPEHLDCAKFPKSDQELCFGENNDHHHHHNNNNHNEPNEMIDTHFSSNPMDINSWYNHGIIGKHGNSHHNHPHYQQHPYGSSMSNMTYRYHHQLSFKCPLNFVVPSGMDYVFRIQGKEHKDCGMPCDGLLFDSKERHLIRIWTGMWAIFCVISTLFTILTFLIEPRRFEYPERAIIFLNDSVACNQPFPQPNGHTNVQMIRTISQGNKNEKCTLLFMTLYFFLISNSIWWIILTISWFLSACLQWGNEAIESNAHYFHLFSWTIPAIMTIFVLAMNKVEGDILTGVCFVGIWNPFYMIIFVLIPIAILLLLGFIFLVSGFISLLHIRTTMKSKRNLEKFDKFMLKIGFFSILYLIPSCTMLVCYYYEQNNIDSFLLSWLQDVCSRFDYGIPCPNFISNNPSPSSSSSSSATTTDNHIVQPVKPKLIIYLAKYLSFLMPGIISGFWIWSEKTVSSWNRIIRRFCCIMNKQRQQQFDDYV
ncbi:frizzled-7-B [Dermatophagoides farinae]|uniref:frizzled-7-B n=1 Tax=Dermatophagoides farinae TaxID=6954 RepID=UPI003F61710D